MSSTTRPCERLIPTCSRTPRQEDNNNLGLNDDAYTFQRLQHASPEHLHITSRRYFVGPLPKGWLQSHRKSWYKGLLGLRDYSSRNATFSANASSFFHHQLTERFGQSATPEYRPSFPQPDDVDERIDEHEGGPSDNGHSEEQSVGAKVTSPPSISLPDSATERQSEERSQASRPILLSPPHQPTSSQGFLRNASEHTVRMSSDDHIPEEFFLAPTRPMSSSPLKPSEADPRGKNKAPQLPEGDNDATQGSRDSNNTPATERISIVSTASSSQSQQTAPSGEIDSNTSLLSHDTPTPKGSRINQINASSSGPLQQKEPCVETRLAQDENAKAQSLNRRIFKRVNPSKVRFDLQSGVRDKQQQVQRHISRSQEARSAKRQQREASRYGEIVRAERMLVRIETTKQAIPDDYNENASVQLETRVAEKWKEYLVVCRRGCEEDTPYLLQLYRTRVIPQVQSSRMKKRHSHEVALTKGAVKINLFSALDKTLVLWGRYKMGSRILIMRARSAAHSVEWYTFIRQTLGWQQPSTLVVHVPDLDISLQLNNPFTHLEQRSQDEAADGPLVLLKAMAEEQAVSAGIIRTCMQTLAKSSEWSEVLDVWSRTAKMGLAWKRYDRLEWIQGSNEDRMYGTIAMRTSHDLELRPKQHYPTLIPAENHGEALEEPAPVEGFLILLTSQTGKHRRWGKDFSKRLYFYSENQYLCFCRPARAAPPAPRLAVIRETRVPTSSEILSQTPITFDVDPYPIKSGEISWLEGNQKPTIKQHDTQAYAENNRNAKNLSQAEGYINLCMVTEVRPISQDTSLEDLPGNSGDVDYHGSSRHGGRINSALSTHREQSKVDRTLELVLEDGLVVRLRSYNRQTRDIWITRLEQLMAYWKARLRADIRILKSIRQRNLEKLEIDEEQESMLGQFAQKWEVARAEASPELFNVCGLSGCRAVKMSGHLYRKPRRRAAFVQCSVILVEGQLLIFQGSLRKRSGEQTPHTHHARQTVLNLKDCYLYSGIITSSDLLYQSQATEITFPGRYSTPRIYLSDGWTSADEDTATTFVIWHGTRKVLFRGEEEGEDRVKKRRWRPVAALGRPGRSIVFRTRSRAERDLWVLAIETEIDRLQQAEDLRIVAND
ncbi:hypothetical protein FQN57_005742 [Myotisia sp. PD_48]|nr:hypothetical protein FQN57_005742 [Myotisia sp. PD_48]